MFAKRYVYKTNVTSVEEAKEAVQGVGFPVMIKANKSVGEREFQGLTSMSSLVARHIR